LRAVGGKASFVRSTDGVLAADRTPDNISTHTHLQKRKRIIAAAIAAATKLVKFLKFADRRKTFALHFKKPALFVQNDRKLV